MTQQSELREVGFYLQDSNLGDLRALMLGAQFFSEAQHSPCSPSGYKPKPSPIVPHLLILSQLHSRSLSSRSSPALQDLGYVVLSPHVQESMRHVALDHDEVQERRKSPESGLSMCPESQESEFCKAESLIVSESARLGPIRAAACCSLPYDLGRGPKPEYKLPSCYITALSPLHALCPRGSYLPPGSMAKSLSRGCPLLYRPAWLLPILSILGVDQPLLSLPTLSLFFKFFKEDFIYLLLERGKGGRKRGR